MAIRNIRTYGDSCLTKECKPIKEMNHKLQVLIEDMLDTMYEANGVGLAAPQVGMLRRICIIDVRDGKGVYELINPEIVSMEGTQCGNEGCLSLPGEWQEVERPAKVTVKAQDRNGNEFTLTGEGLLARAICHETDHLDGVLFIDKVKSAELK